MCAVLAKAGWKNANVVQRWASRRHKRPISSLACEDAGNRARRAEEKAKSNTYSSSLLWETIIRKQALGSVHKYNEICGDRPEVPRRSRLPSHLYTPPAKQSHKRVPLRRFVSYQDPTPWNSPGSATLAQNVADLILVEYCMADNLLGRMKNAWLCSMLKPGQLLVRNSTPGDTEPWRFALGHVNNVTGLCTPAAEHKIEGSDLVYYLPDVSAKARALHPMLALNGDAVGAMTFECRSPLRTFVQRGALAPELAHGSLSLLCYPTCRPDRFFVCWHSNVISITK